MTSTPAIHIIGSHARWISLAVLSLALSGCGWVSGDRLDSFSITYKINIQQGNVITKEMADQLKPGMTRDQVKFVMGTPLLTDAFHANRWDYPFRFQPGRGRIEERRFTVFFENDRMVRFDSDPLPTEEEFAASRNFATTKIAKAPPLGSPKPPTPASTSSEVGGTTITPETIKVPVRPPRPAGETPTPPASDGAAPR